MISLFMGLLSSKWQMQEKYILLGHFCECFSFLVLVPPRVLPMLPWTAVSISFNSTVCAHSMSTTDLQNVTEKNPCLEGVLWSHPFTVQLWVSLLGCILLP